MEEKDDPTGSDGRYRAAIAEVIRATRGKAPLVFEENKNYGFERNLLAVRPLGLGVASICLIGSVAGLVVSSVWAVGFTLVSLIIGSLAILTVLAIWFYLPTEDRVHRIGRSYAERLLDAVPPG
jgi:hypothetical protein